MVTQQEVDKLKADFAKLKAAHAQLQTATAAKDQASDDLKKQLDTTAAELKKAVASKPKTARTKPKIGGLDHDGIPWTGGVPDATHSSSTAISAPSIYAMQYNDHRDAKIYEKRTEEIGRAHV